MCCCIDCTDSGDGWGSGGSSSSGGGGPSTPTNPVEAVKRELGMQSNKLDPDVKDRVEAAIARLGYRVTVGQVRVLITLWARWGVVASAAGVHAVSFVPTPFGFFKLARPHLVLHALWPKPYACCCCVHARWLPVLV